MKKLPLKLKVFLISIYILTILAFIFLIQLGQISVYSNVNFSSILFFGFLAVLTESFATEFRGMVFSTTFGITISSFLLFGVFPTIIIIIIGYTFRVIKQDDKYYHILNTPWYGTLFNYCVLILPVMFAGSTYYLFHGDRNVFDMPKIIVPIIVFFSICFLVGNSIISVLYSIQFNKKLSYSFISNTKIVLLNYIIMAPFGLLLTYIAEAFGTGWILMIIFPIVLARYTFSLYVDSKNQYIQTVDALTRAVEARDKYTEGHSQRVSEIVERIARELGLNDWKIEQLKIASLLHDVGKIGVQDYILNKPGKLTEEEFQAIKQHPETGYNILGKVKNLKNITQIVRYHHERYDGKGYPDGKTAEELGIDVFIVQLADSIDAMATDRPYRKALSEEQIVDEIKTNSGTQFHPKIVEAYLRILKK